MATLPEFRVGDIVWYYPTDADVDGNDVSINATGQTTPLAAVVTRVTPGTPFTYVVTVFPNNVSALPVVRTGVTYTVSGQEGDTNCITFIGQPREALV